MSATLITFLIIGLALVVLLQLVLLWRSGGKTAGERGGEGGGGPVLGVPTEKRGGEASARGKQHHRARAVRNRHHLPAPTTPPATFAPRNRPAAPVGNPTQPHTQPVTRAAPP